MDNNKINELIAEKVFGLCLHDVGPERPVEKMICVKCGEKVEYHVEWFEVRFYSVRDYCGDISAAFEVVAEMEKREYWGLQMENRNTYYSAHFYNLTSEIEGRGETRAEAICRAALKALGIEVEG